MSIKMRVYCIHNNVSPSSQECGIFEASRFFVLGSINESLLFLIREDIFLKRYFKALLLNAS